MFELCLTKAIQICKNKEIRPEELRSETLEINKNSISKLRNYAYVCQAQQIKLERNTLRQVF